MNSIRLIADVVYALSALWLFMCLIGIPVVAYKLRFSPSSLTSAVSETISRTSEGFVVLSALALNAVTIGILYLLSDAGPVDRLHALWLLPLWITVGSARASLVLEKLVYRN
jgi:hypothetical protein